MVYIASSADYKPMNGPPSAVPRRRSRQPSNWGVWNQTDAAKSDQKKPVVLVMLVLFEKRQSLLEPKNESLSGHKVDDWNEWCDGGIQPANNVDIPWAQGCCRT